MRASFAGNVLPLTSEGLGNAGCRLRPQPHVQSVGSTRTPGIPARNGFTGLLGALTGDRACLSPSSADWFVSPVGPTWPLLDLTPASRRQDHTTSPAAHAPFVSRLVAHG